MPILQNVKHHSSVEWVLVLPIHCLEMPVPGVVYFLIYSQVGQHELELGV